MPDVSPPGGRLGNIVNRRVSLSRVLEAIAARSCFDFIQFGGIHELRFDETVVIGTAKLGEQRQGFDVGAVGRQVVPHLTSEVTVSFAR
jgi:hypothetical protein